MNTFQHRSPGTRPAWALHATLAIGSLFAGLLPAHAQMAPRATSPKLRTGVYNNYDVREKTVGRRAEADAARAKYRSAQLTAARKSSVEQINAGMAAAQVLLRSSVPGLHIESSRFSAVPEVVGSADDRAFLTGDSTLPREQILRDFLAAHAAVYGLTAAETGRLVKFSDYTNPAGNLSFVGLRQEINGLPIFQGQMLAAFTAKGSLARTTGNLAAALDDSSVSAEPALTPAMAAVHAASAIGRTLEASRLAIRSTEQNGRVHSLAGGPFSREITSELMYFALEPGVMTLAYAIVLWDRPVAYYVLVDANDGTLLFRKCITDDEFDPGAYTVYTGDSPSPLSPTTVLPGQGTQPAGVSRTQVVVTADDANASPNGWLTDNVSPVVTTGNNCDAGLDARAPDGIESYGRPQATLGFAMLPGGSFITSEVFNFSYNPPPAGTDQATSYDTTNTNTLTPYASGVVTNLFFWTNRYHDRLYNLGFTEAAGNFQTTNTFTISGASTNRGGVAGDPVLAQVHDYSGTDNANFATPPDGTSGVMQMYLFKDAALYRDGALDGDVFLHELTHGVSNRLHGNGSGLASNQSRGMGEGWSDFYARCLLSTADEDVDGVYASGAYSTYKLSGTFTDNYYYGIRRFPYAVISALGANGKPHNPETFADVDSTQINLSDGAYPQSPAIGAPDATEVHNIGEVWCSMLLEMRERIIKRLGYAVGNQRALQIVTDAMKLDAATPSMVSGRDAIFSADVAGFNSADIVDIRNAFAARGLGANASTDSIYVVEDYSPELLLVGVSYSDSLGNGNGVPEPGEDLLITVQLSNVGTSPEPAATARVGNYTATYNLAPYNGFGAQVIPYKVPADAVPGTRLTVPIYYTGLFKTVTYNLTLTVGTPVYNAGFTQTFDSVTPPALPSGWTSTTETATGGTAGTPWKTVASPAVDSGNSAFAPDPDSNQVAGGGSSLVSPAVTLPASGSPQLSFKHTFDYDYYFDGGVLEISVAGGAFTDIVAAGGSFAQNGYNTNIIPIPAQYGNPLGGRAAWTGYLSSPVPVLVNLPPSALGKSVQFRWRLGFDNYYAGTGWNVDTVRLITGYSVATIDTDHDGIPDGYETAHGLNPNDASDAAKDADGDGATNLQEYLAGTDPQNAASVLKITQISNSATAGATVVFASIEGKSYVVEYKSALTDASWIPLPNAASPTTYIGNGGDVTATDSGAVGQLKRFYRVRVTSP